MGVRFGGTPAGDAVAMVIDERNRQVGNEGFTTARDDGYVQCELARAAAAYATPRGFRRLQDDQRTPVAWPWAPGWWKPAAQTDAGRLRELSKAGALILAEMERILRKGGQ